MKKRKTFGNVFLQRFVWITLALALLYLLGLSMFVTVSKDEFRNAFWEAGSTRRSGMRELAEDELEDFDRKQQFKGAVMAESHKVMSILYDADTKEKIAGCEEQFVVVRSKTDASPATMYCYPTADIPGWSEHREKVAALKTKTNLIYETAEMPYFYQNGDKVVPGPFTVSVSVTDLFEFEMATDGYEPEYAFVSSFDAPEEVADEYEKKETAMDNFVLAPLVVGYSPSNPWFQVFYGGADEAYALLQEQYEIVSEQKGEVMDREDESFFKLTMVSVTNEELQDGRKVALLAVACYDVWKSWGWGFVIIAVVLLGFDAVLALVLAKISYTKLKAQYRMEDYRKNLMNTMAHDLKSPLMSISGYAENLENNMAPDKQAHYAKEIQGNVQYMNRIIESVLELSKVEKEGLRLNKEAVDVAALLDEVQKRYELQLGEKKLRIETKGAMKLKADKGLMLQVLDNLLGNAVKYATPDSVVQVIFGDKELRMTNACETDLSDVVDKLCEPFVVGSESRSGKMGSGMGLAIVKNICELHGYRLKVGCEDGQFVTCIFF